jgi:hypothetical protein
MTDPSDPSDPSNPWAAEHVRQLDTEALTAFGIRLWSRHAQAHEMIELLRFALAAADANVNVFVREVFYDSRASLASLTLSAAIEGAGPAARAAVLAAARASLSQFLWEGTILHGPEPEDDRAPR